MNPLKLNKEMREIPIPPGGDKPNREVPSRFFEIIYRLGQRDLRLGQVLSFVQDACNEGGVDLFYIENDQFMEILEGYYKKITDGQLQVATKKK